MHKLGLKRKCKQRKYRSYQGEVGHIADNLLQRNFVALAPNEKWLTDVSEFKCAESKLYLSPIKELFNGEIIVYDLAPSPNFEQITGMMEQAVRRFDGAKPILHSELEIHLGGGFALPEFLNFDSQNSNFTSLNVLF